MSGNIGANPPALKFIGMELSTGNTQLISEHSHIMVILYSLSDIITCITLTQKCDGCILIIFVFYEKITDSAKVYNPFTLKLYDW